LAKLSLLVVEVVVETRVRGIGAIDIV